MNDYPLEKWHVCNFYCRDGIHSEITGASGYMSESECLEIERSLFKNFNPTIEVLSVKRVREVPDTSNWNQWCDEHESWKDPDGCNCELIPINPANVFRYEFREKESTTAS